MVAVEDDQIVGCNYLDRRNPIAAIGPVCIDPAYQGHGIGRKLNAGSVRGGLAQAPRMPFVRADIGIQIRIALAPDGPRHRGAS